MGPSVISSAEEFSSLAPAWLDLWRRSPTATPFQSPMWLLPWWHHFGSNDLHVIAIRDGNKLQALAPLYILRDDSESLGMFLGTGISDYLDVLGQESFIEYIANADCQLWDLQQLRSSSPILSAAVPNGFSENLEDQEPCLVLQLAGLSPSPHFQKKLRYYRRSLEREGEVSFEEANAENLDRMLDSLFALHAARWQRRGMPGMLADDVIQRFHRQVARAMLDAGALRMYAMRAGERIVAVFYGFADATTVYYYLSGYDPDLEKLSPGTLIVAQAIECARRDGATAFDFLRGAENYKYSWGAKERMNRRRQLIRE
jgi:CelD/BcsL family acetyltransferase involved in cellulose biosynthesis